jgi:DNA-binding NtrC family response regulator
MTRRAGAVLVVDDDRHMVRTISDLLRLRGWEVVGVLSGEEALEAVRTRRFDAAVMDIRMAGMNGVETLRAMRDGQQRLPVIFMTAYSTTELLREAERLGALRILPKPFPLADLVESLEQALLARPTVLVVDDDAEFLRTLGTLLRMRNVPTIEASTLPQALELVEREQPGVVVLDLKLGDVEPRDAVLAIHRLSPAVALILYSGHAELLEQTTTELPAPYFSAALRKPFQPDKLLELIDAVARR